MDEKELKYLEELVNDYILDSNNELKRDIFLFTNEYYSNNVMYKHIDSIQNSVATVGFDLPNVNGVEQFSSVRHLYLPEVIKRESDDFGFIFHNDFEMLYNTTRSFMFVIAQLSTKFLVDKTTGSSTSNIIKLLINNIDGYILNSLDLRNDLFNEKDKWIIRKDGVTYLGYNKNANVAYGDKNIITIYKTIAAIGQTANADYMLTKHDGELLSILKNILISVVSYLFLLAREHGYSINFCKYCKEIILYMSCPSTATEIDASKSCPECYIHYERKDEWKYLDTTNIFRKHTGR